MKVKKIGDSMEKTQKVNESKSLPLRYAYDFLAQKGFESQANDIRQSRDSYRSYTSTLRRGKIITLMEENNLLDEFIDKYWPFGKTDKGRKKIRFPKKIYAEFMNNDSVEEEAEEEGVEETSFAYENDLRDYLAGNLSIIEKGLKLFKDENEIEGVEYSVDSGNKRVDIIAIDHNHVPVLVELKVSRGYEKVIGQCLYYRNRIKQLFNQKRVRIIIIAREITPQLNLAVKDLPDVELYEYRLSVKLERIH